MSASRAASILPAQLKLQLVRTFGQLVLDVEECVGGDAKPLAGDLDRECALALDRVGQSSKLRDEFGSAVRLLDVAFLCHAGENTRIARALESGAAGMEESDAACDRDRRCLLQGKG